ncbi:SDR family oxidoreductase [Leucobacter sp. NPDC077196]|uniref:SDR family oxidoreductase n=1 Tax=Leucobacter sp. NPDC077196 TaxID=3154959 RepID=UPI00342FA0EF
MTILITAASGALGHLVVESLIARGVEPSNIVAGARTPTKAASLAERGVAIVELDYDAPATIEAAFAGVDRVLLISGSEVGKRAAQHQAVIDAAVRAGVQQLAYTSLARVEQSSLTLAPEHLATERAIQASGLPATILRNDWYAENYAANIDQAAATGVLLSATQGGRVAAAARADYAEAAAVALIGDAHIGKTYELGGDPVTYDEIAAAIGRVVGRDVVHQDVSAADFTAALESAGLDAGTIAFLVGLDAGIAAGDLDIEDPTLTQLIGRPATPLHEALRAARAAAIAH